MLKKEAAIDAEERGGAFYHGQHHTHTDALVNAHNHDIHHDNHDHDDDRMQKLAKRVVEARTKVEDIENQLQRQNQHQHHHRQHHHHQAAQGEEEENEQEDAGVAEEDDDEEEEEEGNEIMDDEIHSGV